MKSIEYIVKLGGSLLYDLEKYRVLLERFVTFNGHCAFYIGSGGLGEYMKSWLKDNKEVCISKENGFLLGASIHRINALVTCSINSSYSLCYSIDSCSSYLEEGKRPILDTESFGNIISIKENPKTDCQAAIICKYLKVPKMIIVTDVNGIYSSNPKSNLKAKKIEYIHAKDLGKLDTSCVDKGLDKILSDGSIECLVAGIDDVIELRKVDYENIKKISTVIDWR